MSVGSNGQYSMIYNGNTNSEILAYNVTGLQTGTYYSFYVIAINFNG
jgi:hypothetical protein